MSQGYSQKEARAYGILNGASEAGLQYVLGGISSLGGKVVNSEVIQASLDNIQHAVLRIPAKYVVAAAGEMTEEYLQEILNPVFRNLALGEDNEFKLVTEEAAYAALLAALSVGVMEGPNIVSSDKAGHGVDTNTQTAQSVLDGGVAVREDGGVHFDTQTGVDTPATQTAIEGLETPSAEVALGVQKSTPTEGALNEAGLVAISEKEQTQLATGKRNIIASTVKDVVDFAKSALAKKGGQERLYMGIIPDSTAKLILEQTGLDVTGYKAILTGDAVQHVKNKHTDPILEPLRGQRVVTAEDYGMIPKVLAEPDAVWVDGQKDSAGRTILMFSKQIGDVEIYITAQAVTDGRHALTTDSMRIQKRTSHQDTAPDTGTSADPVLNVQNAPPKGSSMDIIPQTAPDVNTETGKDMAAPASQSVDPLIADIRSRSAEQTASQPVDPLIADIRARGTGQTVTQPIDPLIADIRSRGVTGKPGTQTAVEGMETAATEMAQAAAEKPELEALYNIDLYDAPEFLPLKEYDGEIKIVERFSPKQYVVKLDSPAISGTTKHFEENLMNRTDRAELTIDAAQGIINNSRLVLYQPANATLKFLADNGYVVLNMKRKIITVVPEKIRKKIRITWRAKEMAKNHDDKCICPLYGREILYGECYEVQEVRDDEMDMKWLQEPIDIEKANEICEKCRWFVVGEE